jgi:phosphoribosylglycinamide formyltransferase-1
MSSAASEQFISEAIVPSVATCDTSLMASGGPGLPREFLWRGQPLIIKSVVRTWSDTGPCRNGSDEQYVRKHWFEVIADADRVMKVYFDRQPRGGAKAPRWWLFSVSSEKGKTA